MASCSSRWLVRICYWKVYVLKRCTRCGEVKPKEDFSKQSSKKDGLQSKCKSCNKAYYESNKEVLLAKRKTYYQARKEILNLNGRRWYERNKEDQKLKAIERNYNITSSTYLRMVDDQQGRCAICSVESNLPLHIDHDHTCCPEKSRSCGKCVRQLLCGNCNNMLGRAFDSTKILESAANYLRKHSERVSSPGSR